MKKKLESVGDMGLHVAAQVYTVLPYGVHGSMCHQVPSMRMAIKPTTKWSTSKTVMYRCTHGLDQGSDG